MPPTYLRCLNSGVKLVPTLRAAFSTTRTVCAGESRLNSSADLLAALDESKPTFPSPRPAAPSLSGTHHLSNLVPNRKSTPTQQTSGRYDRLLNLVGRSNRVKQREDGRMGAPGFGGKELSTPERLEEKELSDSLSKQVKRRWKAGDVYAPHDLSWQEQEKWARRTRVTHDVFDVLNFNPLEHYRNFSVMSEYMTPMGRIMHRRETGLRPVNQRKIARAIRRSIGMGMMPSVHKHPELLQKQAVKALSQSTGGILFRGQ